MAGSPITELLSDWQRGDKAALDALTPILYQELKKLARARLVAERADHTLQPTALIHEAYLRLVGHEQRECKGATHFFAVASHLMREILVDHARKLRASKRNSGGKVQLDEALFAAPEKDEVLLALSEGLTALAKLDERKAQLIELKYFGGLSGQEISATLGISISTITRESRLAEAWLRRYLESA
jgi:RNA polymerase sigma factor (TIGR02999 family)